MTHLSSSKNVFHLYLNKCKLFSTANHEVLPQTVRLVIITPVQRPLLGIVIALALERWVGFFRSWQNSQLQSVCSNSVVGWLPVWCEVRSPQPGPKERIQYTGNFKESNHGCLLFQASNERSCKINSLFTLMYKIFNFYFCLIFFS